MYALRQNDRNNYDDIAAVDPTAIIQTKVFSKLVGGWRLLSVAMS